ncbi:lipopolysaccharide transport periplasmic protein LptA [Shimia sp.]|uniref:lipopolysaccharide transport periplasmic protein LptA n=1 Tax=Shimia sp. TaxID=1954381 RepID=UPI003567BAAE
MPILRAFALILLLAAPAVSAAQGFEIAFGGLQQDTNQPVEVTADSLSLNQSDGTAVFKGNVMIVQGTMRMSAPEVLVYYNAEASGISRLVASGRVLLVKEQDAAESDTADYSIEKGTIEMAGDVLLTQKQNTLNAGRMVVDLGAGTAVLDGRVKTILRSGGN